LKLFKRIFPLAISLALLLGVAFFGNISLELFESFNIRVFLIFVVLCLAGAIIGSFRLYANLKPFYSGVSFRVIHTINAYSMLSGLFFAGIVGATVTKISLPALGQANKNLVILISIVEKTITLGIIFLIGLVAVLKLNQMDVSALVRIDNGFDFYVSIVVMILVCLFFLRSYIAAYWRLVMVFLPKTILFSLLIVLINLIAPYLIFSNLLDVPVFEKIILSAALMFIGSLPISFQGIGAREVAATLLLANYDISSNLIIGNMLMLSFSSILSVLLMPVTTALFAPRTHQLKERMNKGLIAAMNHIDSHQRLLAIPCVILCLFQAKIVVLDNPVSITLGDFFAVFFVFAFIGHLFDNQLDPILKKFFMGFSLLFCYFVFSFGYGFIQFGFSKWAFSNRLMGSLFLLGYIYAGFLIGSLGRDEVKKTIIFLTWLLGGYGVIFILVQLLMASGYPVDLLSWFKIFSNFRYSGPGVNPEAFAFSTGIMAAIVLFLGQTEQLQKRLIFPALFVYSLSIGLSRSMVGGFCLVFMLIPCFFKISIPGVRKKMVMVVLGALLVSQCLGLVFQANHKQSPSVHADLHLQSGVIKKMVDTRHGSESIDPLLSVDEQEIRRFAWGLFKQQWVFGAGLGGLYTKAAQKFDTPVTLQNSVILYLTDTGIVGVLLIGAMVCWLFSIAASQNSALPELKFYFLGVLGFVLIFSINYDISFQRFLWIWMGFFIAMAGRPWPEK
jgi:hypothetical protein